MFFIFLENTVIINLPYPRIKSERYIPPAGCDQKIYGINEIIPRNCVADNYKISDFYFTFHHLNNHGSKGYFYRVGDDVMKVGCSFIDDSCRVQDITYNVYYR